MSSLDSALAFCASAAVDSVSDARVATAAAQRVRLVIMRSLLGVGIKRSSFERPEVKEAAHTTPHFGQTMRLKDEEQHNHQAEHDGANG